MSFIVQSVSNRRMLNEFLQLPFRIHKNDPCWVPPLVSEVRRILNTKKNPYFKNAHLKLFICKQNQQPISRAAVIIDHRFNQKPQGKKAYFGFFESFNDPTAVNLLFAKMDHYCRQQQVEVLEGPFNPNHYSELGLQVNHFGTMPSFFQSYNPEYYLPLLLETGFSFSTEMYTFKNENIAEYVRKNLPDQLPSSGSNGYTIRSLNMRDFKTELEKIREVFNDAFSENWHFLPLSREEYLFSAKYLKLVTRPELIKIVVFKDEPVGVLQCVLDINPILRQLRGRTNPFSYFRFLRQKNHLNNLIVFVIGIKKAHQHGEVFQILFQAVSQMVLNYRGLETTWLMSDNIPITKACEKLGLAPHKKFIILRKEVSPLSTISKYDEREPSLKNKKEFYYR